MKSEIIREFTNEVTTLTQQTQMIAELNQHAADDFMKDGLSSINYMMDKINKSRFTSHNLDSLELGNALVEFGNLLVKRTR